MEVSVSQHIGPDINVQGRVPDGPVEARVIQRPARSPDGKALAFSAFGQLYLQSLPDGVPRQLTRGPAGGYQPAWPRSEGRRVGKACRWTGRSRGSAYHEKTSAKQIRRC